MSGPSSRSPSTRTTRHDPAANRCVLCAGLLATACEGGSARVRSTDVRVGYSNPKANTAPRVALGTSRMSLPCSCRMRRTIMSPRPPPHSPVDAKAGRVKMTSRNSCGMHGPVSLTSACTHVPSQASRTAISSPSGVWRMALSSRLVFDHAQVRGHGRWTFGSGFNTEDISQAVRQFKKQFPAGAAAGAGGLPPGTRGGQRERAGAAAFAPACPTLAVASRVF